MGTLVAKLLLPTLSSLAFLPTISIAAKRRFHMEAMVYLFTMFFEAVSLGPGVGEGTRPAQGTLPQAGRGEGRSSHYFPEFCDE